MARKIPVSLVIFVKNLKDEGFDFWLQKREGSKEDPFLGLWEFPGGKIEPNEDSQEACKREVLEEVGVTVKEDTTWPLFKIETHEYEDRVVVLHCHYSFKEDLPESENQKWYNYNFSQGPSEFEGLMLKANPPILSGLANYLKNNYESKLEGLAIK